MATLSSSLLRSGAIFSLSKQTLAYISPLRIASVNLALPAAAISITSLLSDIWEGILKAVPKKKTSHSKRRSRFLAGKALKDVKSVVKCPGCGKPKKSHTLCPYCVSGMVAVPRMYDLELISRRNQTGLERRETRFTNRFTSTLNFASRSSYGACQLFSRDLRALELK